MKGFFDDRVKLPVSVDERVKPFIETAKHIVNTTNFHNPTWILGTKEGVGVIQSDDFEDNKVRQMAFIKKKLTELNAEFFIFIHEAYLLKLKQEGVKKFNPNKPVKEHKGSIDCLMVNYQTREGFRKVWSFPIIQDKGKRDLGKPDIIDNRDGKSVQEGRMVIHEW